MWILHIHLD